MRKTAALAERHKDHDMRRVGHMSSQSMPWPQWLAVLDQLKSPIYGNDGIIKQTGAECWRCYYDDGLCPEDALAEDLPHAD